MYVLLIKSIKLKMITLFLHDFHKYFSMFIHSKCLRQPTIKEPIIKIYGHHSSHMSEFPCLHVFLHVLPATASSAGVVGTCRHPSPPSRQPQRSLRLSFSASISSFLKSKVATSMLAELPILPSLLCLAPMTN